MLFGRVSYIQTWFCDDDFYVTYLTEKEPLSMKVSSYLDNI